jgi:hypothetical protein
MERKTQQGCWYLYGQDGVRSGRGAESEHLYIADTTNNRVRKVKTSSSGTGPNIAAGGGNSAGFQLRREE